MNTDEKLIIEILEEGSGEGAVKGDRVSLDYTGELEDGTVFDSSIPRGETFAFKLGGGQVIAGWEAGILGMKVGEKRKLTIPFMLAYGEEGYPGVIPPRAKLIFTVKLAAIN
jgi:FKBP-type peptidyl-prolyl cis-trans isomerase